MQVKELVNLNSVVAKVKELTAKERDGKREEMSEVAKKVTDVLEKRGEEFGCALKGVQELVSAIIGEEVNVFPNSPLFPFGTIIVVTKKWYKCSYDEEESVLIYGASRMALKTSGLLGNDLPYYNTEGKKYTRFATDEEIDKFFDLFDYERGKSNFMSFCNTLAVNR